MKETDLFIYNFIFDLGAYYPIDVSLLGGRFFVSYSTQLPVFTEELVNNYKTFLQEKLSNANTLASSDSDSTSKDFLTWIIQFIENELINYNYRSINSFMLYKNGLQSIFSHVIQHVFLDILLIEFINFDKRLQSFLIRNKNINTVFQTIETNLENFYLHNLLEIKFICESMDKYYTFIETALVDYNYSLQDNQDYLTDKRTNLKFFKSLQDSITKRIISLQKQTFDKESRKEIFLKSIEYLSPEAIVSLNDLTNVNNRLEAFKHEFSEKNSLDWNELDFLPKLLKETAKTKVPMTELEQKYMQILEVVNSSFTSNLPKDLSIQKELPLLSLSDNHLLYLSSQKLKRGENPKLLFSEFETTLSSIYFDVVTNLFPFHYIMEENDSISYIYQLLRIPETDEGIKNFLLFLSYQIGLVDTLEVQSLFFLKVNTLFELSKLDLQLQFHENIESDNLVNLIINLTGIGEILAQSFQTKLLKFPGSFYLSFLVFSSLQDLYYKLLEKNDQKVVLEEIFQLISKNYSSPVKLIVEKIKERISNNN